MIALIKDTDKSESDPGNYRPIFLQDIPVMKVIDRICNTRLQSWITGSDHPLSPEQGGFIAKRGTGEQSFALRELASHFTDSKKPFCAAFSVISRNWTHYLSIYNLRCQKKLLA